MKMLLHKQWVRVLLVALVLCLMLPLVAACGNAETPDADDKQEQTGNKPGNDTPNTNQPDKDDPTPEEPGKDDPEDPADIYDVPDSLPESL